MAKHQKNSEQNEDAVCGICIGSYNGQVKLCDAESGKMRCVYKLSRLAVPVWALVSYAHPVTSAPRLVTGADDTLIRVLDPKNGKELTTLRGFTDSVTSVCSQCVKNSTAIIVGGSFDHTVRVWELLDHGGMQVSVVKQHLLCGHNDCVLTVALASGRPVSGSRDRTIIVWDIFARAPVCLLQAHASHVFCLAPFEYKGKPYLASCAGDDTLKIWDLKKACASTKSETQTSLRTTCSGHLAAVTCLSSYYTSTDQRLVSASNDATLRLWDISTGEQVNILRGHTAAIHALVVFYRQQMPRLASGSLDQSIRVWDLSREDSSVENTLFVIHQEGNSTAITSLAFVSSPANNIGQRQENAEPNHHKTPLHTHTDPAQLQCHVSFNLMLDDDSPRKAQDALPSSQNYAMNNRKSPSAISSIRSFTSRA